MNKFHTILDESLLPKRSTTGSAGYDFIAPCDFFVPARGTSLTIDSGISVELDSDKVLLIYIRSSWGFNKGITLVNGTGIIDSDFYPNTIKFKFRNDTNACLYVKKGEKMAQGIIMKFYKTSDDKAKTKRDGGIGSTGE